MTGTTGWDALVLTISTSPGGADVRVGVVFIVCLVGAVWWAVTGEGDG